MAIETAGSGRFSSAAGPTGDADLCQREVERLAALHAYGILDTSAEAEFDDIARLAASICQAPVALVSLVDADRQWFKARIGVEPRETPRSVSFCSRAIESDDPLLEVRDASQDARFADNPLVTGPLNIRFYAGAVLKTPSGARLGTLCVIDSVARPAGLTASQRDALLTLAHQVQAQLELRREVRERQQAEQRLAQSEAQLRSSLAELEQIYRFAPVGLFTLDRECRFARINERMADINGVAAEAHTGKTLSDIVPSMADHLTALYRPVFEPGEPVIDVELHGETPAQPGVPRYWLASYFPIFDHRQEVTGLIGAVQEVTARKQAEIALEEARERLALALDGSDLGLWDRDLTRGTVWLSSGMLRMLGYSDGEFSHVHDPWGDHIHPDDLPHAIDRFMAHARGEIPAYEAEYRMRMRDGRWLWVQSRGKVVARAPTGEALRAVGTHTNIDLRKRNERRQAFLVGFNEALAGCTEPDNMLEVGARLLGEHLQADRVTFATFDDGGEHVTVHETWPPATLPSSEGRWTVDSFGHSAAGDLRQGQTVVIDDIAADPRGEVPVVRSTHAALQACSSIAVPLMRGGRLTAVLTVLGKEPRLWHPAHVTTAESVCQRLGHEVERAAAAKALRASEETMRLAADVAQIGVFDHDHAAGTLYWSPQMRAIMGWPENRPADLQGYTAAVLPEQRAAFSAEVIAAHDPSGPGTLECQHEIARPDGETRCVRLRSQSFFSGAKLLRTVGVIFDVTDAVSAQAALRQSEALLSAVLDAIPVGILIADRNGALVRQNEAITDLYGEAPPTQDVDSYAAWLGWDAETGAQLGARDWPLAKALEQNVTTRNMLIEGQKFGSDKRVVFINNAAPVHDKDGSLIGAVAAGLDVTESVKAERRLRETEERYRLAAAATEDVIWDWDMAADRVAWNEAVQVFGYRPDEAEGSVSWWQERLHPDEATAVLTSFQEVAEGTGREWKREYRFRRADGGYAYVHDRGAIIRDQHGRAVRAVGAMQDLTERKAAEEELKRVHGDLLRVSRLSAMGAVASTMAHELNQPLTSIVNYLAVLRLRMAGADPQVTDALDKASAQTLRAGEIVRRIRRFASTGELTRCAEPLAEMVGGMWDSLQAVAGAADVALEVNIDPDAAWVSADRVQIEQVISNLLKNAIEAMARAPGKRVVRVSAVRLDALAQVRIEDTGPGLSAEAAAHLFEPFRTSKKAGLGLGLPLCRTMIEAHGGHIWAEEDRASGAAFVFTLPLAEPGTAAKPT